MSDVLEFEIRPTDARGRVKQQRKGGLALGVIYGGGKPNLNVQFDRKRLESILAHSGHGRNTLLEARVRAENGEETDTVMIRELQRDPVRRHLRHADFYRISLSERIVTEVPLTLVGEARGVKEGGRLQSFLRSLRIECLPTQIPGAVEVKVDELGFGDRITVADLKLPAEIRVLNDRDESVVGIVAAREEEAPKPEVEPAGEEEAPLAAK
ncbi:MAG: 50S ribosomal protein L25 [Firmicutes bacterium]|nr:50S ribosomal protein L25 [Bacillota bacterium]